MKRIQLYLLTALTLFVYACKSDDPEPVNEEELITTLIYELTPADGGSSVTFSFTDLDGDGGEMEHWRLSRRTQGRSLCSMKP
jgi:hypothetical protein